MLTIGLVAAIAAIWAVGLGIVDRAAAPSTRVTYTASPTARIERRPALFVVAFAPADASGRGEARPKGTAVPIALVEPNGDLRPPLAQNVPPAKAAEGARAFSQTYFQPGAAIRILHGGAGAGTLRIESTADPSGSLPIGRGDCDGPDLVPVSAPASARLALGISDDRLGAPESGSRPMRAFHRTAATQLMRRAVAEHFHGAQVEEIGLIRVKVADLNRDGKAEIIATGTLQARAEGAKPTLASCFLIAEPEAESGETPYRLAFVRVDELPAGAAPESPSPYTCVDQVDLSHSEWDELVVSRLEGAGRRFIILRRGEAGWREEYAGPAVEESAQF